MLRNPPVQIMIAIDQYGNVIRLPGIHPRKELLAKTGATSASKMYIDKTDGSVAHVGYVVANLWFTLYRCEQWIGETVY